MNNSKIELLPHNQRTYEEVMNFLKNYKSCAITNCTGTGKSYIIIKIIETFISQGKTKILLLAPQWSIIDQFKENKFFNERFVDTDIYPHLLSQWKNNKLEYHDYDLIIADELHRSGAKEWQKAFKYVLENNQNAKIVGASATPRRYDQKQQKEDMVDVMFEGNRAGNIDLATALKEEILPMPTYVATMYSLEEEFESKRKSVINNKNIKDEDKKKKLLDSIEEAKINWEQSHSFDDTLYKYLKEEVNGCKTTKILVFCKNLQHIKEIRKTFDPIFKKMFKKFGSKSVNINEYHYKNDEIYFEYFRDIQTPNTVHILYSVDKFNEGIHIDGLNAIILLRPTQSETIYFQQIGRVLSVGASHTPKIIDFVNNFRNVENFKIWSETEEFLNDKLDGETRKYDGQIRDKRVYFYNETKDAIELFDNINKTLHELETYEYKGETNTKEYFCKKYHKDLKDVKRKMEFGLSFETAMEIANIIHDEILNYHGDSGTLKQLCKKYKKNYSLMEYRIYTKCMSVEEAFDM